MLRIHKQSMVGAMRGREAIVGMRMSGDADVKSLWGVKKEARGVLVRYLAH
jgi:hypothetical protein